MMNRLSKTGRRTGGGSFLRRHSGAAALLFLLLSVLVPPAPGVSAAEHLQLDALIEEALANNPEITAYRMEYAAKRARVKVEGVLDDPMLKIETMEIPGDSPFNITDSAVTKLSMSQLFPFPGKLSLKEDIAVKESLVAEEMLRDKELDITKRVKDAYYDYFYITRSIEITRELREIVERIIDVAEMKYSTGLASQHDVIKAQVELSILEEDLIDLESRKGVIQARINALLNRRIERDLPEPGGEIRTGNVELGMEKLRDEVIKKNPALRAITIEVGAGELATELARKDYYPNFMLGGGYLQRDDRDNAWEAMVGINLPIWWGKYSGRISERSERTASTRSRLAAERNGRLRDLESSFEKFQRTRKVTVLYETGLLPQTELSFNSAMANYGTGKIDFLALLDSERFLLKTKLAYIRTVTEYNKVIAAIERLIGREIDDRAGAEDRGSPR